MQQVIDGKQRKEKDMIFYAKVKNYEFG